MSDEITLDQIEDIVAMKMSNAFVETMNEYGIDASLINVETLQKHIVEKYLKTILWCARDRVNFDNLRIFSLTKTIYEDDKTNIYKVTIPEYAKLVACGVSLIKTSEIDFDPHNVLIFTDILVGDSFNQFSLDNEDIIAIGSRNNIISEAIRLIPFTLFKERYDKAQEIFMTNKDVVSYNRLSKNFLVITDLYRQMERSKVEEN